MGPVRQGRPFFMDGTMVYMETKSFIETGAVAGDFVKRLVPQKEHATVIGLTGDLGSGKTTFVKRSSQGAWYWKYCYEPHVCY